jgi:hypothetical protein
MASHARINIPANPGVSALASRVNELRALLAMQSPGDIANRIGALYLEMGQGRGELHLALLGMPVIVTYPDFLAINSSTDEKISSLKQALLLYYLQKSTGADAGGKWIAFADLPQGRIYSSAFQGYTGDSLAKQFGTDLGAFCTACERAEGKAYEFGDASYLFTALPKIEILITYRLGDEEFPSSCVLLFDHNAGCHLPVEACAILGSLLTHKVLGEI